MIENWGYTSDGFVWMNIRVETDKEEAGMLTLILTSDNARAAAEGLVDAANRAENQRKEMVMQ